MSGPSARLMEAAELCQKKGEEYGHTYFQFGRVMNQLFPNGLNIEAGDMDSWNTLGAYMMLVHKMVRQAGALSSGNETQEHARDITVYGAILETVLTGN